MGNRWCGNSADYVIQYKEIKYKQRLPELDPHLTYSYLCVDEDTAYVGLVAKGGYGNGPYIYKLITRTGDTLVNTTGEFYYGSSMELLEYIIIDNSPEAIAMNCQGFLHKNDRIVLDLSKPSLVYTPTGGRYCAGEDLIVNCQSLGPTATYDWTLPDGTHRTTQNILIPNADPSMNGWYKVSVVPSFCTNANPVRDSIYIRVYNIPDAPHVDTNYIEGCYNATNFNLATAVGAQASPSCILKWYKYTGAILTEVTNPTVAFNNYTDQKFYVNQVFTTVGCESPMVEITVRTLYAPPGPGHKPIAKGCYNDPLNIEIIMPQDTLKYRLYSNNNILLQEIQGNSSGTVFHTTYPQNRYYIAAVGSGCESQRTRIDFTLNPSTPYGLVQIIGNQHICFNATTTLTAKADTSVHNPVYYWYGNNTDTATLLHTGAVFTTPPIKTSSAVFYVAVKGDNYCESLPNQRTQVWVYPNSGGTYVSVNNNYITACNSYSGKFGASTSDTIINPVFRWYDQSYNLVHTGDTLTVTNITKNTQYFVTVTGDNQSCETSIYYQGNVYIQMGGIDSLQMTYEHLIGCDNFGSTVFTKIHGGAPPYSYKFDNDTVWYNLGNLTEIVLPGLTSGSHTIWVKEPTCGIVSKTIVIPPHPEDEVDTTMMSYSDGPASYGIARHIISGCVYIGDLQNSKIQSAPSPSALANTAKNDDALDLVYDINGFVDLVSSGFRVESNQMIVEFTATNKTLMTGKVLIWLDVNKDGKYTQNELMGTVIVPPASNNVTFKLNAGQPYQWLRNGNTYLRFRNTTQTITGNDATDPYRKLGNGEVEDYLLELSDELYTLTKKVEIKSKPGVTEASLGDTLMYTIEFDNRSTYQMCFNLYDYIPANTKYINGAGINPDSTMLTWSDCLNAGQVKAYKFSVVTNTKVGSVSNQAFLQFHSSNDTVWSNEVITMLEGYDAYDDYVTIFACDSAIIDVMANDSISAGSYFSIKNTPSYGTASKTGLLVKYVNTGGALGDCFLSGGLVDTVKYEVCSSNGLKCSEANVIIRLLRSPGMVLENACSSKPRIVIDYQYLDATYDWYHSPDNGATWSPELTGTKQPSLNITKEGIYKVKIHYDGKSYEISKGLEIYFNRKITLPGGVLWYDSGSNATNVSW